MPTGTPITYVAGNGHVPVPTTNDLLYRRAHQPQEPKPQGLDWSALAPSCTACSRKSSDVGSDGLCPGCRAPAPAPTPAPAVKRPDRPSAPRRPRASRSTGPTQKQLERAEFDARAVSEYSAGRTAPQVAKLLGSNNRRVYDALARAGVERRNDRGRRDPSTVRRPSPAVEDRAELYAQVVAEYTASDDVFVADLAEKHSIAVTTIRRVLDLAGVARRDDRLLRSGGKPRAYDAALVAEVSRLYVYEQMSRTAIAERLSIPHKTVVTIMRRQGIKARAGQSGHVDGAASLKQRIADLGVTSSDIKGWAIREGHLIEVQPGIPPRRVVDAYEAAHSKQKGQISA